MKLTPTQKEQLERPRPLLFLFVLGLLTLPWLLLFRNGVLSRQQQADVIIESNAFFAQIDTYSRNTAAQQFDILSAHLGFDPNDPRGLSFRVDTQAALAYRAIEDDLTEFIQNQAAKTSGPLSPLPAPLATYLEAAQPKLGAIQTHLLSSDLPAWEIDIEQMSAQNYPFPGLVNTANVQKLLLLAAIDAQARNEIDEMQAALEASWRLNHAISLRPELTSQVSASVIASYQTGLLRHLNEVPVQWQARLDEQASVLQGLRFDIWLQYTALQKMFATTQGVSANLSSPAAEMEAAETEAAEVEAIEATTVKRLTGALSYWFSPVHYFTLTNIDTAKTAHRAIDRLQGLNVCSTTQSEAHQLLAKQKTARWNNAIAPVPTVLAKRWKTAGDRALAAELTQQVLQAKQLAQAAGQWPESIPSKASKACPGASWVYERAANNSVILSLSNQYSSGQYNNTHPAPAPAIPLQYRATSITSPKKALNTAAHSEP